MSLGPWKDLYLEVSEVLACPVAFCSTSHVITECLGGWGEWLDYPSLWVVNGLILEWQLLPYYDSSAQAAISEGTWSPVHHLGRVGSRVCFVGCRTVLGNSACLYRHLVVLGNNDCYNGWIWGRDPAQWCRKDSGCWRDADGCTIVRLVICFDGWSGGKHQNSESIRYGSQVPS